MAEQNVQPDAEPQEGTAPEVPPEEVPQEEEAQSQEPAQEEPAGEPEGEPQEPEAEAPPEEEPPKPQQPVIPPEYQEAMANWQAAQKIFQANPALHQQAIQAWQNLQRVQQGAVQPQAQEPPVMEWSEAKRQAAQLREQGRHEDAEELLIANHPAVVKANKANEERERREAAERSERAGADIRAHYQKFGEPDQQLRSTMKGLYDRGFIGDLVKTRIAALHELGRHEEALKLAAKAPAAKPQQAVGGRVPAGRGAPAPSRVPKEKPTPGSGIELDYVQKREREARSRR